MPGCPQSPRSRDSVATRAAILASARRLFAGASYDAVGVRDIAAGAGVTAMLVNRYFGSKEGLFAAVVEDTMRTPSILTAEHLAESSPAAAIAVALVAATDGGSQPLEGFLIMLHSASNPIAARISREQTEAHHLQAVRAIVDGDHAAERAALVLSFIAGFQVMRQMLRLSALQEAEPGTLQHLVAATIEGLLQPAAGPGNQQSGGGLLPA